MKEAFGSAPPIDTEVTGTPVEAHGYIVTPVARMRGRLGTSSSEQASGTYGWVRIQPVQASVLDANGRAQLIRLNSVQTQARTGMAVVGLLVALVSLLIPILVRARQKQG
jgi:hypothetical protein